MNGFDAARVLKRLMPSVPLIMYSAFGERARGKTSTVNWNLGVVAKTEHAGVLIHKARGLSTPLPPEVSGRVEVSKKQ